tara:strand:- start:957 stop:2354 length:1398 start_codon:yes stop_codon:yes gene_type:complete
MSKKRTEFFNSIFSGSYVETTFGIDGNDVPSAFGMVQIDRLNFWVDNPRVYHEVHNTDIPTDEITNDHIFSKLIEYHDAIELRARILRDGSIRRGVIVAKDEETNKLIVYEGNTRLAVSIDLSRKKHGNKWLKIPATVLYFGDHDPELVIRHVGDIHLEDETNRWGSHKGATYYWREVKKFEDEFNLKDDKELNKACKQVADRFSNKITKGVVNKNYKLIEFMEFHKMGVKRQAKQYNYWKEYFTISKLQDVRNDFNDINLKAPEDNAFDKMMVDRVKKGRQTGEVERLSASGEHSFRKDLNNISNFYNAFPKEGEKLIFELLDGMRLDDASKAAIEGGASDRDYKMIKDFHTKLFNSDRKKLRAAVKKRGDILLDMIVEIQDRLKMTHIDLKKEYQKTKNKRKSISLTKDKRKYFSKNILELEKICESEKNNKIKLNEVYDELQHRKTKAAINLRNKLETILNK